MSMIYTIENDYLKVSVTTWGAQICSVVRKSDGVEHIWQADKSVWGYHAPILFPYAGRMPGNKMIARDSIYEAPQHGFARLMEHQLIRLTDTEIAMELIYNDDTLNRWPYRFVLRSYFILSGDRLIHRLRVRNRDEEPISFGIGYHPAFALPFDDAHKAEDYEFRFDTKQSPICLDCLPKGLVNGKNYYLGKNIDTIALTPELFANDSYCMTNLTAKTIGIYEKGTGRGVECEISGFPYTLIWSKTDWPARFVCIEPWMSLPSSETDSSEWTEKPAAAIIAPDKSWYVDLTMRFVR